MILLTTVSAGYAIGYALGQVFGVFLFMLIIGGIYFLIQRFGAKRSNFSFSQAIFHPWVVGSSVGLTLLGMLGNAINH
ncbi:hypothetical protein IFO70_16600 [Phormidium tenue FACHB-886]|nr:hypothetical protein [Phormidium tenue FACHB-886]